MVESTQVNEQQKSFIFKTSFSPCTIMQITRYDLDDLAQQLIATIKKAPNFFIGSAVVLDLESIKDLPGVDLSKIKKLLLDNNMVPVGVRGGSDAQHQAAATVGIPMIAIGKNSAPKQTQAKLTTEQVPVTAPAPAAKIITTPIRSGMQIYAKDTDLIVLNSVSAGAELMADGNIHVYGTLRGRALAGVQGNTQARIFCRTLEAELVAIAGYYLVKDDLQHLPDHGATVQIFLENEKVKIAAI